MSSTQRHANTLAHTAYTPLPPEIIYLIFTYLANDLNAGIDSINDKGQDEGGDWIAQETVRTNTLRAVTAVCSDWRCAALAFRAFWGTLTFTHPHFTRIMIERSQRLDGPLHIDFSSLITLERSSSARSDAVQVALNSIGSGDKLKSLAIRRPSSKDSLLIRWENLLAQLMDGRALSQLEHLTLLQSYQQGKGYGPAPAFQGDACPSLKTLCIQGFEWFSLHQLPWSCNVTRLRLGFAPAHGSGPDLPTLLNFLGSMPSLEELELCRMLTDLEGGSNTQDRLDDIGEERVTLGHLKLLGLLDTPLGMTDLFDYIGIPYSTTLDLVLEDITPSTVDSDVDDFFEAIDDARIPGTAHHISAESLGMPCYESTQMEPLSRVETQAKISAPADIMGQNRHAPTESLRTYSRLTDHSSRRPHFSVACTKRAGRHSLATVFVAVAAERHDLCESCGSYVLRSL